MLVDTGSPDELDDLEEELGVKLADVKCALVTHVIKIIAGAGDLSRALAGDHGMLYPTSFFAR